MITTRERLRPSELARGLWAARDDLLDLFEGVLPLDTRHCVFTSQGKAAFEQIVLAAELQRSRILVPAFFPDDFVGIFAKYEMTPVFVDVHPDTYHLDLSAITPELLDGAKSLLVLHTFGLLADGPAVRDYCEEHGLIMIEDCARALGASRGGRLAGSFGHYALFSLPKVTPVRQGGIALSEEQMHPHLGKAEVGLSGLLHELTLVKPPRLPLVEQLEARIYRSVADSSLYPREVGNYDPLPAREFDWLGRLVLRSFMPRYGEALAAKRACASRIRPDVEADGFVCQVDDGTHIFTALSVQPPPDCDPDAVHGYLNTHGVKASRMWRSALGVSEFAQRRWGADPLKTPVAVRLSQRVIQLPVSRFQTPDESRKVVSLCRRFIDERRGRVGLAEE